MLFTIFRQRDEADTTVSYLMYAAAFTASGNLQDSHLDVM